MPLLAVVMTIISHLLVKGCSAQLLLQCPNVCTCVRDNTILICSGSGVTAIPEFPISAITVDLRNNFITAIRATDFEGLINLESLDLSGNRISSIEEGSFTSNAELSTLVLANNMLAVVPDNLFTSTKILNLDISNNIITSISPFLLTGVQSGALVNFGSNQIQALNEESFANFADFHQLVFSDNPLQCSCNLRWLPAFRAQTSIRSIVGTCDEPENLHGANLDQLTEDQLLCNCTTSCVNGACDMSLGECECQDGFTGDVCDTPCPIGRFGAGCALNCTCLPDFESFPCDNVDGTCNCLPGYTGPACEHVCPAGTFGAECQEDCNCTGGVDSPTCDSVNGTCICLPGYTGLACEQECGEGFYGRECAEVCQCRNGGECNPGTGACNCTAGFTGPTCQTETTDQPKVVVKGVTLPLYGLVLLVVGGSVVLLAVVVALAIIFAAIGSTSKRRMRKIEPQLLKLEN